MKILTKQEMYRLYERGRFGNKLITWDSVDDYLNSDYPNPVVLRYKQPGTPWCKYNITRDEVIQLVAKWVSEGADRKLFALNESANDDALILQGEVYRSEFGLHFRGSTEPKPMRIALATKQFHLSGVRAIVTLQSFLDPASYDDLMGLLDDFEGAVVEFSTWNHDVGVVPRRNTVFWEVRHY